MTDSRPANYLRDLGDLVKRTAFAAKAEYDNAKGQSDEQFQLGRLMAFHEVVSMMQQQAAAFDLNVADIALDDVDPERDLL